MKIALIDADSIIYILGWRFKDATLTEAGPEVMGAADEFVRGILIQTGATHYIGAVGHEDPCYRYKVARYKPYKGSRGEPDDWVLRWKPVIIFALRINWDFECRSGFEADDVIACAAHRYQLTDETVVCSPDKDLWQISGRHYDYKKEGFADVSAEQADRYFWEQMLMGDSTDNVAGLPGVGPKKATDKLNAATMAGMRYEEVVRGEYLKYFGDHYGMIIFEETYNVLRLVTPEHTYYDREVLNELTIRPVPKDLTRGDSVFASLG